MIYFRFVLNKLRLIWFVVRLDYYSYIKTYLSQREKGFKKYGKYIENCKKTDYNWSVMITEELVDAIEYIKMLKK